MTAGAGTITLESSSHWLRWRSGVVGNIGSNLVGIRSVGQDTERGKEIACYSLGGKEGVSVAPYQGWRAIGRGRDEAYR